MLLHLVSESEYAESIFGNLLDTTNLRRLALHLTLRGTIEELDYVVLGS